MDTTFTGIGDLMSQANRVIMMDRPSCVRCGDKGYLVYDGTRKHPLTYYICPSCGGHGQLGLCTCCKRWFGTSSPLGSAACPQTGQPEFSTWSHAAQAVEAGSAAEALT